MLAAASRVATACCEEANALLQEINTLKRLKHARTRERHELWTQTQQVLEPAAFQSMRCSLAQPLGNPEQDINQTI